MLSSYASVEILPARRKPHTAVTVGVSPLTNSRLTVKKQTRDESNFGPIFESPINRHTSNKKASFSASEIEIILSTKADYKFNQKVR